MKVLVTGNLGYIGPVLGAALTRAGHEVHGYDSALYAGFASCPLGPIAEQTVADLRDHATLRRAVDRCDAIIQLAGLSNDPLGELDAETTRQVNLEATLNVIELARDRPLIVYSSASVYGVAETPCREDAAVKPLSLYSEFKVAVDRVAAGRGNALILRNGTVHGPAPILRTDLLLNAMVASAVTKERIVLTTTPSTLRPVVDVRDLAELTVGLLERGVTGLYNVASTNISVGEAAEVVARATGAAVVEQHDHADPRNYAMDATKLYRLVGSWWHPRPLAASIGDLIAHYRDIHLTAAEVDTRRYHRIAQFRSLVAPVGT